MKRHWKKQKTRRELEAEIERLREHVKDGRGIIDHFTVENETLRNKLVETTKINLKNQALNARIDVCPGNANRVQLSVGFDIGAYRFYGPEEFANEVAIVVRHEIMRKWPHPDMITRGRFPE